MVGGDLQVEDGVHSELRVIIETQVPRHGENAEKEEDVQLLCRQERKMRCMRCMFSTARLAMFLLAMAVKVPEMQNCQ